MKILFLVKKDTFFKKMSRVRFHGIKALEKLIEVKYSGPGWDDYDENKTVQENIDIMGMKFSGVIGYKPLELKDFKSVKILKIKVSGNFRSRRKSPAGSFLAAGNFLEEIIFARKFPAGRQAARKYFRSRRDRKLPGNGTMILKQVVIDRVAHETSGKPARLNVHRVE